MIKYLDSYTYFENSIRYFIQKLANIITDEMAIFIIYLLIHIVDIYVSTSHQKIGAIYEVKQICLHDSF